MGDGDPHQGRRHNRSYRKGACLVGTVVAGIFAGRRAHDHRPGSAAAINGIEAGTPALLRRRSVWPVARRRERATRLRPRRPAINSSPCNPVSSPTSSLCCPRRAGPMHWNKRARPPPRHRASRITSCSGRTAPTCPAMSPCSAAIEASGCWTGRKSSASPRSLC